MNNSKTGISDRAAMWVKAGKLEEPFSSWLQTNTEVVKP